MYEKPRSNGFQSEPNIEHGAAGRIIEFCTFVLKRIGFLCTHLKCIILPASVRGSPCFGELYLVNLINNISVSSITRYAIGLNNNSTVYAYDCNIRAHNLLYGQGIDGLLHSGRDDLLLLLLLLPPQLLNKSTNCK